MKTSFIISPPSGFSFENIYVLNCHVEMMLGINYMCALITIDVGSVEVSRTIIEINVVEAPTYTKNHSDHTQNS